MTLTADIMQLGAKVGEIGFGDSLSLEYKGFDPLLTEKLRIAVAAADVDAGHGPTKSAAERFVDAPEHEKLRMALEAISDAKGHSVRNLRETTADTKAWQRYEGPLGGEGWQDPVTGEVRYQEDKPVDEQRQSGSVGERATAEDRLARGYDTMDLSRVSEQDGDIGAYQYTDWRVVLPDGQSARVGGFNDGEVSILDEDGEFKELISVEQLEEAGAVVAYNTERVEPEELTDEERTAAAVFMTRNGVGKWPDGEIRDMSRWGEVLDSMTEQELADVLYDTAIAPTGGDLQNAPRSWDEGLYGMLNASYERPDGVESPKLRYGLMNTRDYGPVMTRLSGGALLDTVRKALNAFDEVKIDPESDDYRASVLDDMQKDLLVGAFVWAPEEGVRQEVLKMAETHEVNIDREGTSTPALQWLLTEDFDTFKEYWMAGWARASDTITAFMTQQAMRDFEVNKDSGAVAWAGGRSVKDVFIPERVKGFMRKMYEDTQEQLGEQTKTLYRGTKGVQSAYSNLESWTELKGIAQKFGDYVVTAEVDPEDVFATWETLGDEWPEEDVRGKKEWMVLGGAFDEERPESARGAF